VVFAASTAGELLTLEADSGREVASLLLPGEIYSSPVPLSLGEEEGGSVDFVFVGCRDDVVRGIRINRRAREEEEEK
jgi:hypothetical protein